MVSAIDSRVIKINVRHVSGKTKSWKSLWPGSILFLWIYSPWHRIGIDLVGPLHCTASGNAYIITCTDYFTKWPEAAAIPNKSASAVASFLFKVITRHSSPAIIQSDQGREFVNEVNKRLFDLTGVDHRMSAAYHPQTNGLDERFNQTLVNAFTKMTAGKPEEWDQYIDPVLFAYRYVPSKSFVINFH